MRTLQLSFVVATLATAQGSLDRSVDAIFSAFDKPESPGCVLAVIKDGSIVYARGYGQADLAHDIPITPSTVFHIASISKQFTAASIVMLAHEGRLSLDDDVRKYIPELPDYGVRITLRNLLDHTSGIKDQWNLLGLNGWRMGSDLYTDEDALSVIFRQKSLNFKPGDKYSYSNSGYTLLAQIVKRVSGQTLRQFTTAHIFEPLGMKNTHFRDDHTELIKNFASGYSPHGTTFRMASPSYDTVGPSGLVTTVGDFAKWDRNFYQPQAGWADVIRQMNQPGELNNGRKLDYAFGLEISKYRGLAIVSHSGGDPGYRGDVIRFPDEKFSVICFCNTDGVRPDFLTRKVADLYLAKDLAPVMAPAVRAARELTKEQVQANIGLYWNSDSDDIRKVTSRDGKLFVASTGSPVPVVAQTENAFVTTGATNIEYRFEPASGSSHPGLVETRAPAEPVSFMPVEEFKPQAEELPQYAGRYRSDELDPVFTIAARRDKLFLIRSKFPDAELKPTARDVFTAEGRNWRFVRDEKGIVSGMLMKQSRTQNIVFVKEAIAHGRN
jgi:CubicO group peptidase (beta-lactamase class C family)